MKDPVDLVRFWVYATNSFGVDGILYFIECDLVGLMDPLGLGKGFEIRVRIGGIGCCSCFVEERCDGIQRFQIIDGDSSG